MARVEGSSVFPGARRVRRPRRRTAAALPGRATSRRPGSARAPGRRRRASAASPASSYSIAAATRGARANDDLARELLADLDVRVRARLRRGGTASAISRRPYTIDVLLCSAARRRDAQRAARRAAPRSAARPVRADDAPLHAVTGPPRVEQLEQRRERSRRRRRRPTTSPLRAPVMRASTAAGASRASRVAPSHRRRRARAARSSARGRRRAYSTSTTVRKSGCAPRRSTPQSTNRAARIARAFPPNQRWRCRNGTSASRSMSVRDVAVEQRFPVDAHEEGGEARPGRRWTSPGRSRAVIGAGVMLEPEPVERVRRRASGSTAARRCAGTRSGRASRPASCP